jgi:preprotein translocase subunit SecG
MKTNTILVSCMTALIALLAISTVLAGDLGATIDRVEIDGEVLTSSQVFSLDVSEPVEVKVIYTAGSEDLEDLEIRTWISGYRSDTEDTQNDVFCQANTTCRTYLDLVLPNERDIDDLTESFTLHVELSDNNDDVEIGYTLNVQRVSYDFDLLSVEAPSQANAGDVIAIDVVLKNIGMHELEDSFVVATIPELGIYKKVYFGDIAPEDNWNSDDDAEDARERRVYLVVPADAESGDYTLKVRASNYDSSEEVTKSINIDGVTPSSTTGSVIVTSGDSEGVPNSIIVLTVVLVIIFLVLLIVLVVLLTKKPAERVEDYGETSYY